MTDSRTILSEQWMTYDDHEFESPRWIGVEEVCGLWYHFASSPLLVDGTPFAGFHFWDHHFQQPAPAVRHVMPIVPPFTRGWVI